MAPVISLNLGQPPRIHLFMDLKVLAERCVHWNISASATNSDLERSRDPKIIPTAIKRYIYIYICLNCVFIYYVSIIFYHLIEPNDHYSLSRLTLGYFWQDPGNKCFLIPALT